MKISEPIFIRKTEKRGMPKKRILFIDDEDLLREAIYELLTEMGYVVRANAFGNASLLLTAARRLHRGSFSLGKSDCTPS